MNSDFGEIGLHTVVPVFPLPHQIGVLNCFELLVPKAVFSFKLLNLDFSYVPGATLQLAEPRAACFSAEQHGQADGLHLCPDHQQCPTGVLQAGLLLLQG